MTSVQLAFLNAVVGLVFAAAADQCGPIEENMNYGTGFFGPVHDVTTPAECCSLCAQTKGCVAWNVNMGLNRQNCWLKDNDKVFFQSCVNLSALASWLRCAGWPRLTWKSLLGQTSADRSA